ncbi:uncharacterized protein ColSpa_04059 [Colletotrichum spaethianum]|uniref:Uncharacterized protein n=1 Tax=Colletotrichum spaethianum TaxID=700344 RepID=A0AA37LCL5_9PEZI|nr:uncharacterized protein ColSpa_04059 [Colletotrichum spaethianum]GKT43878.1 hypothetical protein ColSpa_04059 [Colletotrichum spaethianum]
MPFPTSGTRTSSRSPQSRPLDLLPDPRIQLGLVSLPPPLRRLPFVAQLQREEHVALELGQDLGQQHPLRLGRPERGVVDLRAANDKHLAQPAGDAVDAQVREGLLQRADLDGLLVEVRRRRCRRGRRGGVQGGVGAADDDVETALEGSELWGDALPRLAAHDDGVAGVRGGLFKCLQSQRRRDQYMERAA